MMLPMFPWIVLFFPAVFYCHGQKETTWEKVKESDGIEVFQKKIGEDVAFRGVGILTGESNKFIEVLHDPSTWSSWVENLKSGEMIEKKSDSHFIFRQVIGTPFPMKDREAVFQSIVSRKNRNTAMVDMKSVNHPSVKRSDQWIRVEIIHSRYIIEDIVKGKLRVTFQNLTESSGAIPNFLSNWASMSYPVTLLQGIERVLQKNGKNEPPFQNLKEGPKN